MTTPANFPRSGPLRRRIPIHGDPSLIAGHSPWSTGIYYFVLLAAMGVDLVTFHQVLLPALDESEEMLWVVVTGFTVICIAMSHTFGQQAKKAVSTRHAAGSRTTAWVNLLAWVALGAAAFAFRWEYSSLDIGTAFVVDGVEQTGMSDAALHEQHLAAWLFLALYVSTGVVSGGAGFLRHQPEVSRYNRALSLRTKAAAKHSRLESNLHGSTKLAATVDKARLEHAQAWESLQVRCIAAADRVKREIQLKLLDKNTGQETELPPAPRRPDLPPRSPGNPESPDEEDELR
ncbi:hypothetical protein [Lentzea flaviverrucosa]|uniref:Uncharacterized protein n=1 Tax=Lentzea flaviverrucosa TaxID=200379 RepID=A0A1H9CD93_9PSEU|nr:hypothetical protein [Lentzea flaviverrucosa]RDI24507.1 hypothetical protein DFR72_10987 [Lentzea flaviverrucosa]SEP98743.1 hypothetical protein SAMN05216195_101742 [Lentzea flaviverrucosa]